MGARKAVDLAESDMVQELESLRQDPDELNRQLLGMGVTESGDEPTDAELLAAEVRSDAR